jgi:hypothetical protein
MTEDQLRDPFMLARPMTPAVWLLYVMVNQRERIASRADIDKWAAAYWAANPRLDGQQWRRGGLRAAQIAGPVATVPTDRTESPAAADPQEVLSVVSPSSLGGII